jgi:TPR repeat protein
MKKKIFNSFLFAIFGVTLENVQAASFLVRPVTIERMTAPSNGLLPIFESPVVLAEICQDLKNFDRLDFFQKGQVQKQIFESLWSGDFESLIDPVNLNMKLNKELALESGLASLSFYKSGVIEGDGRAVLPLLEMLNDFTFCKRPEVREWVEEEQYLQTPLLMQKAAEITPFEEFLKYLLWGQRQGTQKRLIDILQNKMENYYPDPLVLASFIEGMKKCSFRYFSPAPFLRVVLNHEDTDLKLKIQAAFQVFRVEKETSDCYPVPEMNVLKFLENPEDPSLKNFYFPEFLYFLLKKEEEKQMRMVSYIRSDLFPYSSFIIDYYLKKIESSKKSMQQFFQIRIFDVMEHIHENLFDYLKQNQGRFGFATRKDLISCSLKVFTIQHRYAYAKILYKKRMKDHLLICREVLEELYSMLSDSERKAHPEVCLFLAEFLMKDKGEGGDSRYKALQIYRFLAPSHAESASILEQLKKKYEDALELVGKNDFKTLFQNKSYKDLEYSAEGYDKLGRIYFEGTEVEKDHKQALSYFLRAEEMEPKRWEVKFLIAQIYEKYGTPDEQRMHALKRYRQLQKMNYPQIAMHLARLESILAFNAPEALLAPRFRSGYRETLISLGENLYFRKAYELAKKSDISVLVMNASLHLEDLKHCRNRIETEKKGRKKSVPDKRAYLYAKAENSLKMIEAQLDAVVHPSWKNIVSRSLYMTFFSEEFLMGIVDMFGLFYHSLIGIPENPPLFCELLKNHSVHAKALSESAMVERFLYDGYQKARSREWLFSPRIYPYLHTDPALEDFFKFKIPAVFSEALVVIKQKQKAFSDWFLKVFLEKGSYSVKYQKFYHQFKDSFFAGFAAPFQQAGREELLQKLFEITRGDVVDFEDLRYQDHPACPKGYFYQMVSGIQNFFKIHLNSEIDFPEIHLNKECQLASHE